MFESLSSKLQNITSKMKGKARVTEQDIKDMMREIRMALLEADVNYTVVKEFCVEIRILSVKCDVVCRVQEVDIVDGVIAVTWGEIEKQMERFRIFRPWLCFCGLLAFGTLGQIKP